MSKDKNKDSEMSLLVSPVTDPGFDLRGAWSTVNRGGGGVSTSLKVLTVVV